MFKYFINYGDKNFNYNRNDNIEVSCENFEDYFNSNDVVYDFLYGDLLCQVVFKLKNLEDGNNEFDIPIYLIIKWVR